MFPPACSSGSPPFLLVDLKQGSYFTIRPRDPDISAFVPEWCAGNIYDMEGATPHPFSLPVLSLTEPTSFDLFVSGDYEVSLGCVYSSESSIFLFQIRLFGDPLVRQRQFPVQLLSVNVAIMDDIPSIQRQPSQDITCHFVSGYAFGDCIGVAIQSWSGWWTVNDVKAQSKEKVTISFKRITFH